MEFPRISIVTPSFNGATTIRETLESVCRQKYPNLEHWVVDGGSKDSTLDIVREYPHILWTSEKDEGHYHAMNKGIQRSTGEIIGILNSDDCYRDGALLKIGRAFREHPDWDGLFCDVVFIDDNGKTIFGRKEACYDYDVLRFGSVCYIVHPTLFLKKAVYERLGAYRHRDYLNCCDAELILRLGQNRCKIGHIPEFLVDYRFHQHGQSADVRVRRNTETEYRRIRHDHGCPSGFLGTLAGGYGRVRRQFQKLVHRGSCDLIPGRWRLQKHMREKTTFSSNIGVDQLRT
jgi:glycosyltransferase involved in cell wall biosynthesis